MNNEHGATELSLAGEVPYYATIFTTRMTSNLDGYDEMADRMAENLEPVLGGRGDLPACTHLAPENSDPHSVRCRHLDRPINSRAVQGRSCHPQQVPNNARSPVVPPFPAGCRGRRQ